MGEPGVPIMTIPLLSVVTTSRNDNHGGTLNYRTQRHIDCLHEQATDYQIPIEYILVEWNPPKEREPITNVLNFYPETEYWHPRIITVPHDIHRQYRYNQQLPLFQMIGKNVGIRRATAQFILCTNIDILLSDEMFLFVTGTLINKGISYRTDRWDVGAGVPPGPRKEMFKYCLSHILRRCGRAHITDYNLLRPSRVMHRNWAIIKRKLGNYLTKYPSITGILLGDYDIICQQIPSCIHTMACGDFTLMHRDDWAGLRGYPELEIFSIHIDSLLLVQAYYSGIREAVVPFPIFHIEHQIGTGLVPGSDIILYQNLTKKGIPYFPLVAVAHAAIDMESNQTQGSFMKQDGYWVCKKNTDAWGLADHDLLEVTP
jgi:hypothetical protein